MKATLIILASERLALLCLALVGTPPRIDAQTPASLSIQTYAGLTITGTVGKVYAIHYATNLTPTNYAFAWPCLEFVQLPASPHLWIDKSGPAAGRRFYRALEFGAPTNTVFIPPGSFRMGSQPGDNLGAVPQTVVTLTKGFFMGKYEVTQGEYLAVVGGVNPSGFSPLHGYPEDLSRPVENLTWSAASNYCARLTQQERAAGRIATNSVYRLPTEAEWEYACRAWTSDRRFSYGDDQGYTNLTDYAWYMGNSQGYGTHPVGQRLPNPWGLYDMHGNVSEWCQDWFGPYPGGAVTDPQGPSWGYEHVYRGGMWPGSAIFCLSAFRQSTSPLNWFNFIGFRVVLAPTES